jgi:diguanylate cyclase
MSQLTSHNRRILIVDDDSSVHHAYTRALSHRRTETDVDAMEDALFGDGAGGTRQLSPLDNVQFEVDHAYQGQEALAKLEQAIKEGHPYAAAFVDMRMPPGWDGVETIEQLWNIHPSLQVTVCSAYSDYKWNDIVKRLQKADQLLLLRKPFDPIEVWQIALSMSEKWNLSQLHLRQLQTANDQLARELGERKRAEDRARHDAMHDALTGLPNRALLTDRVEQAIQRVKRKPETCCAVIFLDLDNFKIINDSLGHKAGDFVLCHVADRLREAIRDTDTLGRPADGIAARLGGDEFVVLLEDLTDPEQATVIATRMRDVLSRPLTLEGRDIIVGGSLGIAIGTSKHASGDALLREADTAMYRAKFSGKSRVCVFDQKMHEAVLARLSLESDMRGAETRGEFHLAYQPVVKLATGEIMGFEALLRWSHPQRGALLPEMFIPIAEESGQISRLGAWVVEQVASVAAQWRAKNLLREGMSLSLNVSRLQLLDDQLLDTVVAATEHHKLPGRFLAFEVTENAVMQGGKDVVAMLRRLRDMGSDVLMDDFGTGHSSLSCLHKFPISVLKIDRSFVDTMRSSADYAAVVQAIVVLAHNLRTKVIAEGIETTGHLAQLQTLDCDYGQGYIFSPAVSPEHAEHLLARGTIAPDVRKAA